MRTDPLDRRVGVGAVAALIAGTGIVAVQRAHYERFLYISELGGELMTSEMPFRLGFVLVAFGIAGVAFVVRDVRANVPVLRAWAPAMSLAVASALFFVASQVNCSRGCPAIGSASFQLRDAVHIVAAVLAFVAGCWAMLQFASARERWMRRLSIAAGLAIGAVAATGGILSLLRLNTDVGSTLEFIAAGLGILWLVVVTIVHVWARPPDVRPA